MKVTVKTFLICSVSGRKLKKALNEVKDAFCTLENQKIYL